MKKLIAIAVIALAGTVAAQAQSFGVIGGFTSSNTSINTKDALANLKNVSLYHVGAAVRWELGNIFAIQPQLAYQVKGSNLGQTVADGTYQDLSNAFYSKTGFIELSAGLQAGLDLLAFRPFVLVEPFVGYAVTGTENFDQVATGLVGASASREDVDALVNDVKNKLEYGVGAGLGLEIASHVQLSCQLFRNFGKLYKDSELDSGTLVNIKSSYKDLKNYQGVKFTLAILF